MDTESVEPMEEWFTDPPWCNGSTPAFGAVQYRFESYGRNFVMSQDIGIAESTKL